MEMKCHGVGVVATDPESRDLENGSSLCTANIVFNRNFKNKDGEWQQESTFVPCKAWGRNAEKVSELSKGQPVFVEGVMQQETWEGKGGKRHRLVMNILFVQAVVSNSNGKNTSNTSGPPKNRKQNKTRKPQTVPQVDEDEDFDDDAPF